VLTKDIIKNKLSSKDMFERQQLQKLMDTTAEKLYDARGLKKFTTKDKDYVDDILSSEDDEIMAARHRPNQIGGDNFENLHTILEEEIEHPVFNDTDMELTDPEYMIKRELGNLVKKELAKIAKGKKHYRELIRRFEETGEG
jgi:hypothetical protein